MSNQMQLQMLELMHSFTDYMMKGIGKIDISRLTKKQRDIWFQLEPRAGVVFLKGRAGISKSATAAAIARNILVNGKPLRFVDIRLSQKDETYFGFPARKEVGENFQLMTYALPEWFMRLAEGPTLINFEELNRCSQDVRNAALEILNERTLHGHKVPDHVFMIATGNLGDEDGCNVEEFDNALISRLITVKFTLSIEEWISDFADPEKYPENEIHPLMVYFLKQNREHFYFFNKEAENASITNARSLTNFCKYLGGGTSFSEFAECNAISGHEYYAKETQEAIKQWLDRAKELTIDRVKNNTVVYPLFTEQQLKKMAADLKRDRNTLNFNSQQMKNVDDFIKEHLK